MNGCDNDTLEGMIDQINDATPVNSDVELVNGSVSYWMKREFK